MPITVRLPVVRLFFLAVIAAQWLAGAARASELFDQLLAVDRRLSCTPRTLNDDSMLTIGMPEQHGAFLVVRGPIGARPVYVVYPKPRFPLQLTAKAFRKLTTLTMKVRDMTGVYAGVELAFPVSGRYRIIVGSGFDTPNPVVDGWCEVEYETPQPFRELKGQAGRRNRVGAAWNKMKCTPTVLTETSTLKIDMPFPHGSYLTVALNGGNLDMRYLVYPTSSGARLLDHGDFERMRSLSLHVADMKLRKPGGIEHTFVKPGRYLIVVGDALESDGPEYHGWCWVTYRPQRRP